MKTQEQKETFLKGLETEIDILNYINDIEDINSFDDLLDVLNDNNAFIQESEVVYYASAIEYLQKNDPSLQESLAIAEQMGFSLNNLSSESLASLLKCELITQEFYELESEIEHFFNY